RRTHYDYDAAGRVQCQTDATGVVTFNSYSGMNLTSIIESFATTQARETRRRYDAAGRLIEETIAYNKPEAITQRFKYDSIGNQIALTDPRGVELAEGNTSWAQTEGQRLGYSVDSAGLSDIQRGELLSLYTSTQTFDKAGCKISATSAPPRVNAAGSVTRTIYNAAGNIVKVIDPRGYAGYFYYGA